jgi:hypothetical protein
MDIIVSDFYCHKHRMCPQPGIVEYVYECCPSDSLHQTLLIIATAHDVLYFRTFGNDLYREAVFLCPEFGVDVLDCINDPDGARIPYPRHESYCSWHTHKKTKKCD